MPTLQNIPFKIENNYSEHNRSKMTPVTNNHDIPHDEVFNGQEVEAAALPPPTEMAVNHPEDKEEELEHDVHSTNTNRWRPGWSRSRALTAFLATAGVGAVVGTGSVVFRAASGKTSISSKQAAAVATDLLIDDYIEFGDGFCLDGADKR
jgi:hypothetical protein